MSDVKAGQVWSLRSDLAMTVKVERVTRGMVFTDRGRVLRKTWHARFVRSRYEDNPESAAWFNPWDR